MIPSEVRITVGRTVNTGNFSSVRAEYTATYQTPKDTTEESLPVWHDTCYKQCIDELSTLVEDVTKGANNDRS